MALTTGIVDRCLPIHVLPVHIVSGLCDKEFDCLCDALSGSVEDWGLLERVFLLGVNAKLNQHFNHLQSQLRVTDNTGCENERLIEILGLVLHA